jgi:hypothetical protein
MAQTAKFDEILANFPARRSRSRLETYRDLILKLLRRRRTYREIAAILIETCHVHASISTIHDFVRRTVAATRVAARAPKKSSDRAIRKRKIDENSSASEDVQQRIEAVKLRRTAARAETTQFQYDPNEPLRISGKSVAGPPGKSDLE